MHASHRTAVRRARRPGEPRVLPHALPRARARSGRVPTRACTPRGLRAPPRRRGAHPPLPRRPRRGPPRARRGTLLRRLLGAGRPARGRSSSSKPPVSRSATATARSGSRPTRTSSSPASRTMPARALGRGAAAAVLAPSPDRSSGGVVACTGSEFCRFAIVETKAQGRLGDRDGPSLRRGHLRRGAASAPADDEVIRMHFSGCPASCAQPQIADIGFRGDTAYRRRARSSRPSTSALGGSLGADAAFGRWVLGAIPVEDVPEAPGSLLVAILHERRRRGALPRVGRRYERNRAARGARAARATGAVRS